MIKDEEAILEKTPASEIYERIHTTGVLIGLYKALNALLSLDITTNDDIESVTE